MTKPSPQQRLPQGPGPLFPIRETFHSEVLSTAPLDPVLEVEEQISLRAAPDGVTTLVSTSLYCPPRTQPRLTLEYPEGVDYDAFSAAIPGPREKYYFGLQNRRYQYPDTVLRIYLAQNLRGWIPWLRSLGFHQVFLMASSDPGWAGHLWRYLPMLDPAYRNVLCTGVDPYPSRLLSTLQESTDFLTAVLYTNRWMMPFAGPVRTHPGTLSLQLLGRNYDAYPEAVPVPPLESMEQAISGYLAVMADHKTRLAGKTFAHVKKIPKLLDAGFLTMLLWKEHVVTDPRARFLERGMSEYRGVEVQSLG